MLVGIASSIAAAALVFAVGALYRHLWKKSLRRALLRLLTRKGVTEVRSYLDTLPAMQQLLSDRVVDPDLNVVNILCFMGHDLTFPEDRIVGRLRDFLHAGGTANLLVAHPESPSVAQRARLLNMNPQIMKQNLETSLSLLRHHFASKYPQRVSIRTYNEEPLFRLYFIRDTLFLGFYLDLSSYNGDFYEVPHGSPLYAAMRIWFNTIGRHATDANTDA